MVSIPFQIQVIFQIQDILILLFCYIWCIYVHDISEILNHSIHPIARSSHRPICQGDEKRKLRGSEFTHVKKHLGVATDAPGSGAFW